MISYIYRRHIGSAMRAYDRDCVPLYLLMNGTVGFRFGELVNCDEVLCRCVNVNIICIKFMMHVSDTYHYVHPFIL